MLQNEPCLHSYGDILGQNHKILLKNHCKSVSWPFQDPVTVRVGDQLVWVTLEGRVPLPTNYAPSSEDILGMKG
jgi:hypothetical protein